MPPQHFHHALICLTDHTDYAEKISRPGVALYALQKTAGAWATYASEAVETAFLLDRFSRAEFDWRLTIVGDGPLVQTLCDRFDAESWGYRVSLPGAHADVANIMRSSTVCVLPSLSEATQVTIFEAMATGMPVVASRVVGVSQLVLNGRTGLLVDPSEPEALADALSSYICDSLLRARHGAAGREHVLGHYSIDGMVVGYDAQYSYHRA